MTQVIFKKDPDAVLDYKFDWTAWLAGDTISSETVAIGAEESPSTLEVDSYSESSGVVTAWLSGGTAGQDYRLWNRIVTAAGRTNARRMIIKVMER